MKRKYVECEYSTLLFKYFEKKHCSIDWIKSQIYGSNIYVPVDFPEQSKIPELKSICNNLINQ